MSERVEYGTTNPVLVQARLNHDPYDDFAWVQEWRFSIAQFLTDAGEYVSEFRGADDIRDAYEYETLVGLYPNLDRPKGLHSGEVEELWYAFRILDRYREWLRIAGKDY